MRACSPPSGAPNAAKRSSISRTFVRQLRKKIEDDPAHPIYLLTDMYVGYRFADPQMLEERNANDVPLLPDGHDGAEHSSAASGGC